jgi:large subunit ribosomal protein L9
MPPPRRASAVDRKQVALSRPIKELGLHTVHVTLHPEVDVDIVLNVARSTEEAELQASGKSIQELAAEEEAAAEFEIAELFDDIGAAQLDDLDDDDAPAAEAATAEEPASEDDKDRLSPSRGPGASRICDHVGRIPRRDAAYIVS